jgi:hypothetical protein
LKEETYRDPAFLRSDEGGLEKGGKLTLHERQIGKVGDEVSKNRRTGFEKGVGYEIKRRRFQELRILRTCKGNEGGGEKRMEPVSGRSGKTRVGEMRLSWKFMDDLRLRILEGKSERKNDRVHDSRHRICCCQLKKSEAIHGRRSSASMDHHDSPVIFDANDFFRHR